MNPARMRLSPAKRAALLHLERGTALVRPRQGKVVWRSPVVITTGTMQSLEAHGLVDASWRITERGRRALAGPVMEENAA